MIKNSIYYLTAILFFFFFSTNIIAQNVGINSTGASPDNSAMLDITSPDKGLLIPRMDSTSRKNIVTPAEGLMVFDSTYNSFYFYDGMRWTSVGTDNQDLSLSGNSLSLTNDGTPVDLSGFANTDNQDLSLSGNSLNLTNDGTPVDLSGFANTDNQDLSLSGNSLSLTNDGTPVDLSGFANTDNQDLSLSGNSLSLTNDGTPVDLSSYLDADNLGNHTATQNVLLDGNWITYDGSSNQGLYVDNTGQVGVGVKPREAFEVGSGIVGYSSDLCNNSAAISSNSFQSFREPSRAIDSDLNTSWISSSSPSVASPVWLKYDFGANPEAISRYVLYSAFSVAALSWTLEGSNDDASWTVLDTRINVFQTGTYNFTNTTPYRFYRLLYTYNSFGVVNLNDLQLIKYEDTRVGKFSVSNSGVVTINEAYALPNSDGANNQVLTTDGAGNASWAPITGNDNLGNHTTTQNLIIGSNAIQNNASSANGLSMGPENQLLVESDYQRTGYFTTTGTTLMGEPLGNYIEVSNKTGTRSIFGSDGHGLSSPTDTLNTVVGNWTAGGGITFHVSAGVKVMTLDASGRLGIGRTAATNRLEVEGAASKTTAGNWLANSDARLKKNITSLSSEIILEKMLSLQGVTYEWNDNKTNTKRPEGIQYGFTAQNIQEVFPTLVTEDNNGFLQTPYGTYDAMTIEAIRALNNKIEKLENLSRNLAEENAILKSKNKQLETNTTELAELKNAFAELKILLKENNSSAVTRAIESEE